MSTRIAIGFSSLNDPVEAFKAAAIDVKTQLNAMNVDLAIIFATASYADAHGLDTLRRILHPMRMIGSITPGIILSDRVEEKGVAVIGFISSELHFGIAALDELSGADTLHCGFKLVQSLLQDYKASNRSALVYFYDGLKNNGTPLCTGLRENLGMALPIIGAVGGDSAKMSYTRHFFQAQISEDSAVGLLIGGAHGAAATAHHSWQPLGKPRIIDAAKGNIILTIDGQPAVRLYENYFQTSTDSLKSDHFQAMRLLYPLGIGTTKPREYLIRAPIDILKDGSIVCQGDIPPGSRVHLMITDKDACRQSMHHAAISVREKLLGKQPKFIMVFESFMRRKILGRSATQGLHAIREALGPAVPLFGMYTFGEIAPMGSIHNISTAQMLNGSLVLLAIG